MGSPATEVGRYDNEAQRQVEVAPYLIQTTQVTQSQWLAVMGAGNNPSHFQGLNRPVERVSYDDVQEFITRLNGILLAQGLPSVRLPIEEEWEYAARAGTQTRYPWGDEEARLGEFAWGKHNAGEQTHDVDTLEPNAFGLYHMLGNVWEWTSSLYQEGSTSRVFRGGGWYGGSRSRRLRPAVRDYGSPGGRSYSLGFRLVRAIR